MKIYQCHFIMQVFIISISIEETTMLENRFSKKQFFVIPTRISRNTKEKLIVPYPNTHLIPIPSKQDNGSFKINRTLFTEHLSFHPFTRKQFRTNTWQENISVLKMNKNLRKGYSLLAEDSLKLNQSTNPSVESFDSFLQGPQNETSSAQTNYRTLPDNKENMTHRIARFSVSAAKGTKLTERLPQVAYSLGIDGRSQSTKPQPRLISDLSFHESSDDNGSRRYKSERVRRKVWSEVTDFQRSNETQSVTRLVSLILEKNEKLKGDSHPNVRFLHGRNPLDLFTRKYFGVSLNASKLVSNDGHVFAVTRFEDSSLWEKFLPGLEKELYKIPKILSLGYSVGDLRNILNSIAQKLNVPVLFLNHSQTNYATKDVPFPFKSLLKRTIQRFAKAKRSHEPAKEFHKGYIVANLSVENSTFDLKNESWYYNMTCDKEACPWDNKTTNLSVLATQGWSVSKCNSAKCVLLPADQKQLIRKYIKDLLLLLSICVVMVFVFIVTFYYCVKQKIKKADRAQISDSVEDQLSQLLAEVTMETATGQDYRNLIRLNKNHSGEDSFLKKLYQMHQTYSKAWSPPISKEP